MKDLWELLKSLFGPPWLEHHLLYFSGAFAVVIVVLIALIVKKTNEEIKEMKEKSRKNHVKYIRDTSKHNPKNKPKKLNFE